MKSRITYLLFFVSILIANNLFGSNKLESKENIIENSNNNCGISKNHSGGCWNTEITSVIENNGKFDIEILVTYVGQGGGRNGCKELSHFSIDVPDNTYSNISWEKVSGNVTGTMKNGTGRNDPFDKRGFKLDDVSNIGDGEAGSFKISYTLDKLQDQQFLAKAGNDYSQIAVFEAKDFGDVKDCITPPCETADNTTSTASITENETKTLTGTPAGGTFTIVSGGGSITNGVYTPDNINTNTDVTIKYTIAADGSCVETSEDITFTVTPVCDVVADNTTSTATIVENETKTLLGSPSGGTWSIISGNGTINGNTYTPNDLISDENVTLRYTIAEDGDCAETSDDVTFNVRALPTVSVVKTDVTCFGLNDGSITFSFSDNTGRTHIEFSLDGGNTYQNNVSDDSGSVTYSNLAPGTYDVWARWGNNDYPIDLGTDLEITEPAEVVVNITTSTATINEGETKTLSATPSGGNWAIISGGGIINNGVYTPDNINTNTTVKIRYTIPENGTCSAISEDVIFTVIPVCTVASNSTSTASINENETKTLVGTPAGGTWSIVSGSGVISNNDTYTPDDINTNETVQLKYTLPADGDCASTSSLVSFSVTPVCDVVADNTTSTATILENETKTLTGAPAGGTFTIVSGGGSINNGVYTPDNINTNTDVTIRYTVAADGDCAETSEDITFTVTPVCDVVADNTTSTASIAENETKTLTGAPAGGTWSIVSGGGSITNGVYTPDNINTNTDVTIRYTVAADGTCSETSDDITFTVTPVCDVVADNTTTTASITENETKTLTGAPAGGTWSIVSGGGSITNGVYTPDNINTETTVVIRYTIAADGSCGATSDDVTFIVEADINCSQFNPTNPANGFNVFTLNDLTLTTNETEGAIATGGNLTIAGNYQITTNDPGTFTVNNVPVGLVVGGRVIYQNGNSLQINQNTYVKIGESNGSVVWYQDQNNAFAPIRITKNSSYNSSPRIMMQASSNQLNVSSTNNPVFQQNVIDFASAFQNLQTNSTALSQKSNNAQLTNPNGQSISNTNLPNQVKINLQNGINYLNITGSDLNNVNVFTYNNKPSASRVLIINEDASGTFNWDVWNQAGVGQQDAPYILYNF